MVIGDCFGRQRKEVGAVIIPNGGRIITLYRRYRKNRGERLLGLIRIQLMPSEDGDKNILEHDKTQPRARCNIPFLKWLTQREIGDLDFVAEKGRESNRVMGSRHADDETLS